MIAHTKVDAESEKVTKAIFNNRIAIKGYIEPEQIFGYYYGTIFRFHLATTFKEVRFRCYKPWHGRTVDLIVYPPDEYLRG